ncbi:head-tail connector protein [Virgibacillus sp. DJP39]|uniref:head-tail connector protein n=1 Tax=Virgibacillus sp. DJP39 TaxID=3409790 RepID=UPI003BB805D6
MNTLLEKVKANLILSHDEDNALIGTYISAAISYAESFQHFDQGYYNEHFMSPATEQGTIMLATHFYESRDGSTGGFFGDNVRAAEQVWNTVHLLLRMGKEWKL